MKYYLTILLVLATFNSSAQTRCLTENYIVTPWQQKNIDIIHSLVEKYKDLAFLKHKQSVKLKFHLNSCDILQLLGGHNKNGELVLEVYSGALKHFDEDSIVAAVCHEIGHVLGNVSLEDAGIYGKVTSRDAVEGEADYFAGGCSLDYFENASKAKSVIKKTYKTIYRKEIDESLTRDMKYSKGNGISPFYPSPECRLLSAFNGLEKLPRPKCWYNPELQ